MNSLNDIQALREALEKSEERLYVMQKMLDNLPSMIGYWDTNLVNRYSNQAYKVYFNKSGAEIEGRHISELLGNELYQKNLPYLNAALLGEAQFFERDIPLANGEIRHTQAHYVPDIRNSKVHGIYVLVFDVTATKTTSREKERILQQLSESYKMVSLGEMAGGIAHEINTPLGIISLSASMAQKLIETEPLDRNKISNFLDKISRTTTRISKIVTGLLLFSKDRRGEPFSRVKLAQILEDTIPFCNEKFKNHGINLTCPQLADDLEIECRPSEISQVLVNLLNNAFDAIQENTKTSSEAKINPTSPPGLNDKWIKIEAEEYRAPGEQAGQFILISVTDSGPGIKPELREKIMEPFFTTKEVGQGTGLGLSISKGIIEAHGGQLTLDPHSLHTRFLIKLPRHHIL